MNQTSLRALMSLAVITSLAACSDGSGPGGSAQVSLNVATQSGSSTTAPALQAPDTLVDAGGNVLVLTSVELVLREVELKRQHDDGCDSVSGGGHDSCEEFETGPFLLDLPLGSGVAHQVTIDADSGTFDEIEFKIHKPEDDGDAADQAFLAAHPDLRDVSVRVTGSFNGNDFVFTSDLGASQEVEINPPLVIATSGSVDLTLMVDVSGWFLNGAVLVDPSLGLKGGPLEGIIQDNIEASFDAFHDDNHDGHDDDE